VNTDAPWPSLDEARLRVLEIQAKLHQWSKHMTTGARGEPDAVEAARPVRGASRGNGPAQR